MLCLKNLSKELACITEIYNEDLKNWAWFCKSCHMEWDNFWGRRNLKNIDRKKRIRSKTTDRKKRIIYKEKRISYKEIQLLINEAESLLISDEVDILK
jgi:hypothetical protein